MDAFYITLPSTASMDIYPENAVSHFTTRLQKPLDLSGRWAVGLCEISMPSKWDNVSDKAIMRFSFARDELDETLTATGKKIVETYTCKVKPGFYETPQQLIQELNYAWTCMYLEIPKRSRPHPQDGYNIFTYDNLNNVIRFTKQVTDLGVPSEIFISMDLALILGIGEGRNVWESLTSSTRRRPINLNIMAPHVYLYSDICEYVPVGHTLSPLLRIIPMASYIGNSRLNDITHTYDKPHYINLSRQYIEQIHIDLRDELGQYIAFASGKSIIKLHLRRIK